MSSYVSCLVRTGNHRIEINSPKRDDSHWGQTQNVDNKCLTGPILGIYLGPVSQVRVQVPEYGSHRQEVGSIWLGLAVTEK